MITAAAEFNDIVVGGGAVDCGAAAIMSAD